MRRWPAAALAAWLLCGCGMYGALYLEEEVPPAPDAPPVAVDPATANDNAHDAAADDEPDEEDEAEGGGAARGEP